MELVAQAEPLCSTAPKLQRAPRGLIPRARSLTAACQSIPAFKKQREEKIVTRRQAELRQTGGSFPCTARDPPPAGGRTEVRNPP